MAKPDDVTCSRCGYDLQGLPAQGRCPECGQVYSALTGQGIGQWGRGRRNRHDQLMDRLRTISLFVIAGLCLAMGALLSFFATNPARPVALGAIVAAMFILAGVTSYVYEE